MAANKLKTDVLRWAGLVSILLLLGYTLSLVNLSNPGYLSSDDLNLGLKGYMLSQGSEGSSFFAVRHFMYRPLREYLSNRIAAELFDYPFFLHATLVTLHLLASLMFCVLIRVKTGSSTLAVVGYVLAVVFPTSQHVVNNFAALADQLVALFALAIALIVVWREKTGHERRVPVLVISGLLTAVCMFLALLSKESAVVLPGILFVYMVVYRRFQLLDLFAILAALSTIYLIIRIPGLFSVTDPNANYRPSLDLQTLFWNTVRFYSFPFIPKQMFITTVPLLTHTWYFIVGAVGFTVFLLMLLIANFRMFLFFAGSSLAILAPISMFRTIGEHQLYVFGLLVIGGVLCIGYALRRWSWLPLGAVTSLAIVGSYDRALFLRDVGVLFQRSNASLISLVASELAERGGPPKKLDLNKLYFGRGPQLLLPLFEDQIVIRMQDGVGQQRYPFADILHDRLFALNTIAFAHPIFVVPGSAPVPKSSARTFHLELRPDGYLIRNMTNADYAGAKN